MILCNGKIYFGENFRECVLFLLPLVQVVRGMWPDTDTEGKQLWLLVDAEEQDRQHCSADDIDVALSRVISCMACKERGQDDLRYVQAMTRRLLPKLFVVTLTTRQFKHFHGTNSFV
jgi:hypothetical protein